MRLSITARPMLHKCRHVQQCFPHRLQHDGFFKFFFFLMTGKCFTHCSAYSKRL